jgi:hypothetical protein
VVDRSRELNTQRAGHASSLPARQIEGQEQKTRSDPSDDVAGWHVHGSALACEAVEYAWPIQALTMALGAARGLICPSETPSARRDL